MHAVALATLNMPELDRLKVIQAVVDMGVRPGRAAERLGLTVRQVERLVIRYQESGAAGLASRRRGRSGNRKLDEGLAQQALAIIRERYADFGPPLACEKLRERHGIGLSVETVRALMMAAGLWIPRRDRPAKVYQPRNRRACLGELIQIDGSDHHWFEERAPACTLLVFIDDATGRLMALHCFGTAPESAFNAHRPLRADEDFDTILTRREPRRVTRSLTQQYDRVIYLLDDTETNRGLLGRYIDVYEYPDGRIEARADGVALPCTPYDRLSEIDHGAVVDHKRLSHVLQVAQLVQAERDNRRASGSPSRTNQGQAPKLKVRKAGTKKQREITADDMRALVAKRSCPRYRHPRVTRLPLLRKPGSSTHTPPCWPLLPSKQHAG